jgi:2-keto-4-pentenoate hydratase/2-oxohepta-3-ene-1,7-dioic acid hydratase in catechol pathway
MLGRCPEGERDQAMRIVSFEIAGRAGFGLIENDGIIDAGLHLEPRPAGLRDLLGGGGLDRLAALQGRPPDHAVDEIRFAPVIPDPAAKFLCVGINYMPHIREMGRERPDYPVIFVRFAGSLVGHREALIRPLASEKFDFEGELAVIIGERARRVSADRAMEHIAGFSCFNDGSIRDYQRHGPQWTPGKNFPRSGAFGPWMVTPDEAGDPARFHLRTTLNGTVVQDEDVSELCFGIGQLIEYCSQWTVLEPGDVIVTGTPGGVGAGRTPPLWMKAGDSVGVEISGIGTLSNPVVDEEIE